MNKKIIFFTSSFNGGGAEIQLRKLFEILQSNFECIYLTAKDDKKSSNLVGFNKKKTIFSIFKLLKKILIFNPDILISTLPTPNVMNAFLKKIRVVNYKCVVRIANYNLELKTTKFIIKNADVVFFNSTENLELYQNRYPHLAKKFFYLNNIVESNISVLKKTSSSNVRALTLSRIVRNKGLDLLIDVMNELDNNMVSLDIYGNGPELGNLRKKNRNPGVSFCGKINNTSNLWNNYDLFILPSRKEGLSNSLLEAQLNNTFSIASDCKTGNKEVINLTKNGCLFESENLEDLKAKILNFVTNKYTITESHFLIKNSYSKEIALKVLRSSLSI
tara:strand:- start:1328 stop:2323 length:996 start_codon:yes stop_codon:yes gene_type:complete